MIGDNGVYEGGTRSFGVHLHRRAVVSRGKEEEVLHLNDWNVLNTSLWHIELMLLILVYQKVDEACEDCGFIEKAWTLSMS